MWVGYRYFAEKKGREGEQRCLAGLTGRQRCGAAAKTLLSWRAPALRVFIGPWPCLSLCPSFSQCQHTQAMSTRHLTGTYTSPPPHTHTSTLAPTIKLIYPSIHHADTLLSALIPGVVLLHLFLAPYTKVEESFNIQAAHDILTYGVPWGVRSELVGKWLGERYDHLTFTGAVPRSFVGPLAVAGVGWPSLRVGGGLGRAWGVGDGDGDGGMRGQLVGES